MSHSSDFTGGHSRRNTFLHWQSLFRPEAFRHLLSMSMGFTVGKHNTGPVPRSLNFMGDLS
jgi:hypothetical protein